MSWAEAHPVRADLYRYGGSTGTVAFCRTWLHSYGFRFMVLYRLTTRFRGLGAAWIPLRILMERAKVRYGIDIATGAQVGPGLHISHFGGITIGPTKIGRDCNISKGVTIGNIRSGSRQGRPLLGDAVWVGVNATLVGGIVVGDGAAIAPGAFVNFDVPAGALVMGNPGVVVGVANPEYVRFRTAGGMREASDAPERPRTWSRRVDDSG